MNGVWRWGASNPTWTVPLVLASYIDLESSALIPSPIDRDSRHWHKQPWIIQSPLSAIIHLNFIMFCAKVVGFLPYVSLVEKLLC